MTDNYEFSKSCMAQGVELETPYSSKQWNFINDINGGVYTNNGLSLVQFDLSSIYNSSVLVDPSQMYITVPICLVSAYTSSNTAGTTVSSIAADASWAVHGLKSGYWHLLHGADLIVNGKTINQFQPNINSYIHFKMLSSMSQDDLASFGISLGMGTALDNPQSLKFNSTTTSAGANAQPVTASAAYPASTSFTSANPVGGNGIVNNAPFSTSGGYVLITTDSAASTTASTSVTMSVANTAIQAGMLVTGTSIPINTFVASVSGTTLTLSQAATASTPAVPLSFFSYASNGGDEGSQSIQFQGAYNNGYYSRLKKYSDVTNGTFQSLYGATSTVGQNATTILTQTQTQNEFKPYTVISGNYIITYDIAVLRLQDIFDSMKNLCLMKKFDGILRMYFNTGSVASTIQQGGYMVTSAGSSTFVNTCPLLQSCLVQIPATAIGLGSGLFISRATTTNLLGGLNLGASNAAHALTSCRVYFPQVTLKPEKLRMYLSENRAKKIVYTDVLYNQFNSITSGSTFSALVQSGVTNVRGILIIPFNSSTTNGALNSSSVTGTTNFAQIQSPFDTSPATTGPFSLINLQVAIGGINQLSNTLNYSFENFLQQVTLYEKINQADIGISCGLISEFYWNNGYRTYYVDCSRGNIADQLSPRNVNVTFTNNTNCTLDIMVFTEYYKTMIVDVEVGTVTV